MRRWSPRSVCDHEACREAMRRRRARRPAVSPPAIGCAGTNRCKRCSRARLARHRRRSALVLPTSKTIALGASASAMAVSAAASRRPASRAITASAPRTARPALGAPRVTMPRAIRARARHVHRGRSRRPRRPRRRPQCRGERAADQPDADQRERSSARGGQRPGSAWRNAAFSSGRPTVTRSHSGSP